MLNVKQFIATPDYQELKQFISNELITRPLDIKATDVDGIALEVRASQIAIDKVLKAFKKFELTAKPEIVKQEVFR